MTELNPLAENPYSFNRSNKISTETLPFIVKQVSDPDSLGKAIAVRHAAYARHVPVLASRLKTPEPMDLEPGAALFLAQAKDDGRPLGSVRLQTNQYGPLALEQSIRLPDALRARPLTHISRLAVARGNHAALVKPMLFKALFLYGVANRIEWAVVAARRPLDRMYESLHFQDVFPQGGFIALAHMGNLMHRIMALELSAGYQRWQAADHPLTRLVFHTHHPDLWLTAKTSCPNTST